MSFKRTYNRLGLVWLFFYCNFRGKVTLDGFFAVILRQLIQQLPSIPKDMETLYEANLDSGTRLTLEKVLTALDSALLEFSRTFIVIDALDECELPGDSRKRIAFMLTFGTTGPNETLSARTP